MPGSDGTPDMTQPSWRKDKRKTAERGYGSKWQAARAGFLRSHPLCVMCVEEGRTTVATVVDHKVPHRGDQRLFWDRRSEERRGGQECVRSCRSRGARFI